jgi:PelA/Pel-15E family pectate lyase
MEMARDKQTDADTERMVRSVRTVTRKLEATMIISMLTLSLGVRAAPPTEAVRVAEIVLLYQRDNGGWPKNYDKGHALTDAERTGILAQRSRDDTTFDNGATHSEVRHLAKVYQSTGDERYKEAALKGIEFTLRAQYANGGWPQFYPKAKGYSRHITFNDNAMIGVMSTLRDIARREPEFTFVDEALRVRAANAVAKGIPCILKCQVVVHGKKTAWCAQHDETTLAPAQARSYELPSLSGSESVGLVRFLMGIDRPTPEIVEAVQAAIAWFDKAKLEGIREIRREDPALPKGWDKVIVPDASAPPMWARFYEIGSNKPIFCSRDGIPKRTLAEISYERRNGYSWLGYYAASLLAEDYPAWQKKWAPNQDVARVQ